MKQKLLTLLLAVAASVEIMFASDTSVDGIWYNFDSNYKTASVTFRGKFGEEYNEYSGAVIIPAKITFRNVTYKVTGIGKGAFYGCTGLTSVTIPNSVTSIGEKAFYGCGSLTSVTIPNSFTSIGYCAFQGCTGLISIKIPTSVTSIGAYAFCGCSSLTSVSIPTSVTSIGEAAFQNCTGLKSISIPSSVTSIGTYAFCGCSCLTSVTIPNNVTSIEKYTFSGCTSLRSVTIPNSVTSIIDYAFKNCTSLKSITIPSSVTIINNSPFRGCNNLTSVTINSNTLINANQSCNYFFGTQVKEYIFGSGITSQSIGYCAFQGCTGLISIKIPTSVTSIGKNAFQNCTSLTSITIPNSVTSLGDGAFTGCNKLKNIYFTGNLAQWCNKSWSPANVSSSYDLYVQNVKTTDLTIPNSVTSIKNYTFSGCTSLTSVTIPNSVTSIGESAFQNCSSLTSVIIQSSVTNIATSAFSGCNKLKNIYFTGTLAQWCNKSWSPAKVSSSYDLYLQNVKTTDLTIPNSVTSIKNYTFSGCTSLTSVTIPNSVTSIGESAFQNCSSLTSVIIQSSVTNIATSAFSGCNKLKNIYFTGTPAQWCNKSWSPANVSSSYDLYVQNAKITDLTIPNNVTSIGKSAFQNCSSLISVNIPSSVTSIGESAFQNCSSLTSVIIPSSVTNIGGNAFYNIDTVVYCGPATGAPWGARNGGSTINKIVIDGLYYDINYCDQTAKVRCKSEECVYEQCAGCKSGGPDTPWDDYRLSYINYNNGWNITKVNIPDSIELAKVTTIGEFAFYRPFSGNTNLKSVSIPQGVKSIGGGAFALCTGLTSVSCYAIVPPSMGTASWDFVEIYRENDPYTEINNSYRKIYGVFGGVDCSQIPLYVPRASVEAYRAADQWKDFKVKSIEGTYTITFQDYDGTELLTLDVMEDSIPVYKGAMPARPEDDVYVYTFSGWTPTIEAAISNTIYTATYTATRKSYTITWLNEDGSLIDKTIVEYGKTPTHANPTKAATAEFSYTFAGWTPNVVAVTGDATYTATFNSTVNKYNISVNAVDGSVNGGGTYPYGTQVKLTAVPNYGYHFTQWSDGNTENPRTFVLTRDTTFTAEFEKNSYTISTTSANQEWGTTAGDKSALYLENVVISATANYGYHFVKWNDNNTENPRTISVTKDATYTATFAKNTYSITKNANSTQGFISGVSQAEYLDNITLTVNPNYGYHFTHWSDGNTDNPRTFVLTQDTTFTAEFEVDKSGTCGKDNLLQWTFADDGTLTISGSGELTENYTFGVEAPTQMQQLVIGNEVTAIGERAFYEKNTLQKLIIGSNVTSIGKYAFARINNRQLTSLVMPAELLTIGDYAFSGNTYLESIDFNAKLQSIGAYAFKDCYRVSEMTCLATVTPDLGTDALASINSYASLCVPAECLRKYKVDPNWGRFDLCELGASSTTIDGKTVIVEPSDNTALFTWPTENNACSYTLQISKDGEVFCTFVFNTNGQLTGIAFAPGRNGAAHAPAATMSVAGMSFTVTGLDGASKYAYRLAVTNDASEELVAYSGEFATTGYNGEVNPGGNPTGIEDIFIDEHKASKILRDGQIFILRGEKIYTLTGQEVK